MGSSFLTLERTMLSKIVSLAFFSLAAAQVQVIGSPEWQAWKNAELAHIAPSVGPLAAQGVNYAQEQLKWQQQQLNHQAEALAFVSGRKKRQVQGLDNRNGKPGRMLSWLTLRPLWDLWQPKVSTMPRSSSSGSNSNLTTKPRLWHLFRAARNDRFRLLDHRNGKPGRMPSWLTLRPLWDLWQPKVSTMLRSNSIGSNSNLTTKPRLWHLFLASNEIDLELNQN